MSPIATKSALFWLWLPLAATRLIVAGERPLMQALIARLEAPTENLAAFGVSISILFFVECPVWNILSAANAVVSDYVMYRRFRNFSLVLSLLITFVLALICWHPLYNWLAFHVLALPTRVAQSAHTGLLFSIPVPIAVGYRRFFQGVLTRFHLNVRVAYASGFRLVGIACTAWAMASCTQLDGCAVGMAALSGGAILEALAVRIMAQQLIGDLKEKALSGKDHMLLSWTEIMAFYLPLGLMSVILMGMYPLLTLFVARCRMPVESLAVLPVITSFAHLWGCLFLALQELVISMVNRGSEYDRTLWHFAKGLLIVVLSANALILFTPGLEFLFAEAYGLSKELIVFASGPAKLIVLLPLISLAAGWQQGFLVRARRSVPITWSSVITLLTVAAVLFGLASWTEFNGVVCGLLAVIIGRVLGAVSLVPAYLRARSSS